METTILTTHHSPPTTHHSPTHHPPLTTHHSPSVATIGFFDGVHGGHRYLIRQVTEEARRRGMQAMVITFLRHPRQVLSADYQPQLLTTTAEKEALLATTGVDRCVLLPFDKEMSAMSARDFMRKVLRERLGVGVLITGYDNRFGHNRAEGFDDYVRYGQEMGIEVLRAKAYTVDGVGISSSVVRSLLLEGEARMAARCLGYDYMLTGTVVPGEHVGRTIGFPTANIQPDDNGKLIPAPGAYAVRVTPAEGGESLPAMMNIGCRPTFGEHSMTLEAHILNFSGDIYGRRMVVSFVERLRAERKFRSAAELKAQLQRDAEEAARILAEEERQTNEKDITI